MQLITPLLLAPLLASTLVHAAPFSCGRLLQSSPTADERTRLMAWLEPETKRVLGRDSEVRITRAFDTPTRRLWMEYRHARGLHRLFTAFSRPGRRGFDFDDDPHNWASTLWETDRAATARPMALAIFGDRFAWRAGDAVPVRAEFVIFVAEYDVFAKAAPAWRSGIDPLTDVIERARAALGMKESVQRVTSRQKWPGRRLTYLRIAHDGDATARLRATLAFEQSLEREISSYPTNASLRP